MRSTTGIEGGSKCIWSASATRPRGIGDRSFDFRAGETIHTENSYKYSIEQFQGLCREANYEPVQAWTDPAGMFSLHYLNVA